MLVVVGGVTFQAPAGWTTEQADRVLTLRGPRGEIAMVSGAYVEPTPGTSDAALVEHLTRTQLEAAEAELRNPSIELLKPLQPYQAADDRLRLWMGIATTRDRALWFAAAVIAHPRGAALLTLQAANPQSMSDDLRTMLASMTLSAER